MTTKIEQYDNNTHQRFTTRQNVDKALHTLEGILKGISIDDDISEMESAVLSGWIDENAGLMKYPRLKELSNILEGVCRYKKLGNNDKESILYICQNFQEDNEYYNDETADIQVLHGMLHGILADEQISISELEHLKSWLKENRQLQGTYPYDEIYSIICDILNKNDFSTTDENLLKVYFSQFANIDLHISKKELDEIKQEINKRGICSINPTINIKGSLFCFTGKSTRAQRKEIATIIEDNGGFFNDRVVADTDYLIVGNEGNPDWAYACYGRKVEKAIQMRQEGKHIQIINELDFWKLIDVENDSTTNDTSFWDENSLSIHSLPGQIANQNSLNSLTIQRLNTQSKTADILSDEDDTLYHVTLHDCTCMDYQSTQLPCRHMYALANKLKLFVNERNRRSKKLIADFSSGYAANWFFCVREANYLALDIVLSPRRKNKQTIMVLTQGKFYNFHDGSIFYDNKIAYEVPWGEALKKLKYSVQIVDVIPTTNKITFVYDNTIIRQNSIAYGDVTFKLYQPTADNTKEECVGTYTCKQDEFLNFLKTGKLKNELNLK